MKQYFDEIDKILSSGTKQEKIKILESLVDARDSKTVNRIISQLDDPDIEVRGEVFSSLVLNENKISKFLIQGLKTGSKNIKGFGALILANRGDADAISAIINLTKDSSSMVRACALGALGYLKAETASKAIDTCFSDSSLEVRKSALKAAIDIGYKVPTNMIAELTKENDPELNNLVIQAKQTC